MAENGDRSAREHVLEELGSAQKVVVVTHENPDGDALGSLMAMGEVLSTLGKDCVKYIDPRELPLPPEYRWLPVDDLQTEPPDDLAQRTVVFLDCGNLDRNPAEAFKRPGMHIVNIDHHHDNTRFGTVNLIDPEASCTAEIVWDLMGGLGVPLSLSIAEALYVGLITDTGRFMYENTTPRAHVMAADLIAAGAEPHLIYRQVYEEVPFGKLVLLARALAKVERHDGGLLTLTELSAEDFTAAGAEESYSEGIIDYLRAVEGTAVAALVRDRGPDDATAGERKVSLRANDARVDVSQIARAQGGGGHRQAAGFSTGMAWPDLVQFLRSEITEQLAAA
jgi:phosphoesterase RecJ-like protein